MCRESIEQNGFAIIPEVFAQEEIASLVENITQSTLRRSRAGMRHALANNSVATLAKDSRLLEIAQKTSGKKVFPFRATLFNKSLNTNWLVVWHQDTALPLRERLETNGWGPWSVKEGVNYAHAPAAALSQVLALRVHLDDSTARNGPLRVLPGTHTLGVLNDDEIHQLAKHKSPVDCLVSQGGILGMRPLLIHSSSKSRANITRRVLHIEYAASPMLAEGLELAIA